MVQVDDDLDIMENSLPQDNVLRIERSSSEHFTLKGAHHSSSIQYMDINQLYRGVVS